MGTNLMRAMLLTTASVAMVATAAPTAAYAQEATYQIDIPAQSMGDALRALGKATKQNIVFNGSLVKGKRSAAVRGRMSASAALEQMIAGSGLKMGRGSGGGYTVQAGNGGAAPASASARPAAAQGQGRGTVTGTVKDEASGAALKGALVELVGTGRTTSTDDLGEFRFANVSAGDQTVRVSYLGYVGQQSSFAVGAGESYAQDFTLTGGSGGQEIVVYGQRSARAAALNQERTAENVTTVISSDELGAFQGTTLSESLRKASGVAFERDSNTGDGTNIIVRGLAPDFNAVKVNGIELPEGSGNGRSASLSNILTESVGNVKISKTLLPNQDSTGTGGLIEIETKTPFDRDRRYVSFTTEGAKRAKGFNDEFLAAGTLSGTFGSEDQFGLSVSVQYRDRSIERVSYDSRMKYPFYFPRCSDGTLCITGVEQIDPRLMFPLESTPGADRIYPDGLTVNRGKTDTENLGITFSAAVKPFDGTELFFDFQRFDQKDTALQLSSNYTPSASYTRVPIQALGGEVRDRIRVRNNIFRSLPGYTYTPSSRSTTNIFTIRGNSKLGPITLDYSGGYTRGTQVTRRNSLFITRQNDRLTPDMLLPEATDPVELAVITTFGPRTPGDDSFPFPLLNDAGFAYLNDPARYIFEQVNDELSKGRNSRYAAETKGRYDFNSGVLRYVELGASFEQSRFDNAGGGTMTYRPGRPGMTAADVGLNFAMASLGDVGVSRGLNFIRPEDLVAFFERLSAAPAQADAGPTDLIYRDPFIQDPRQKEVYTQERELAGYIQGRFDFGKLEIIGGARLSHVAIETRNLTGPIIIASNGVRDQDFIDANASLVTEKVKQTDVLPRVLANYRLNENSVVRAGYYLSVARPQISLMSSIVSSTLDLRPLFGPAGDRPRLNLTKGNPDLKPARTHSFDVSLEHYSGDIGVMKLGAFYKRIDNFLENNVSQGIGALDDALQVLPSDPRYQDVLNNPGNYFIAVGIPTNSTSPAHIWGFEASLERRFNFLPGALSGLGIFANYTYTKSSRTQLVNYLEPITDSSGSVIDFVNKEVGIKNVPFTGQSPHSGTVAVTYNKYGMDASVGYTWQSRAAGGFALFNLSPYAEAYGTLDARLVYQFKRMGGDFRIFAEGSDLLRGTKDAALQSSFGGDKGGPGKYFTGASYFGGRQFRIGVSANF